MRILITITIVILLSSCDKSVTNFDNFKVITGAKCTPTTPTTEACSAGDAVGEIELDAKGNPSAVNIINSCPGKKVTWKYKKEYAGDDAPPFLVIFDPAIYPGNGNNYKVLSSPKPNSNNATNQEFTLNTRKVKSEEDECLNYAIMIPGKGLLDPIFIIKR
jgi:hypothetical protein